MRFFVFAILLSFLTGCKTPQPVIERTVTITEIQRDTVLAVKADTAFARAWFECDSLNRVVMKKLEMSNGRRLAPKVSYTLGLLEVTMPVDSEAVYFSWKERYQLEAETITETKIVRVKEKPPWYIKLLSWIGAAALFSLAYIFLLKRLR